jgi:predicted phosphoribosyltransferase
MIRRTTPHLPSGEAAWPAWGPEGPEPMLYRDRVEAGEILADDLAARVTRPCVVAAVPRGGAIVARPVAERLRAPLTVVYAQKLTAPRAPELAFGSIDEDGYAGVDPETVAALRLTPAQVEEARLRAWDEVRRRMELYRVPPLSGYLPGLEVVLVDDGIATGLTLHAALSYSRFHGAARVIVAAPCASSLGAERFAAEADHLVCPVVRRDFIAVGDYYEDFGPVEDDAVIAALAGAAMPAGRPGV